MKIAQPQTKAYIYALLAVLFWSTAAAAFKISLRYQTPVELLCYASIASTLILGAIIAFGNRRREFSTWSLGDFFRSAVLGLLNPFLYYLILLKAYSLLPAQEAQPLNFIWPIVLVLLSGLILHQPISLKSIVAMLVSFFGVVVISTRGNLLNFQLTDPLGVGLALGSALIWAVYWLYSAKDTRNPVNRLFMNFSFGLVYIVAYMSLIAGWQLPSVPGLLGAAYVGTFEMGLAFVAWLSAMKLTRHTAQIGSLVYITPFLALLVVYFVVGEPIFSSTPFGIILIVGGIILQQRWAKPSA